ncbi:MAG TPA: glycoside hydrolase family 140 protein, partial [Chitinophagaceae bacterium]|nr:glycoside hydrolase family 140 protein [Chitinophagaceae bacterium]
IITIFFLLALAQYSLAQFAVDPSGRYLLKDGKPFFWLGDTGWELFQRLDLTEADRYFKRRSEQGFTVVQAVVLAEMDGLHTPNANGDTPLENDDPSKPNEKYFKHIDDIVDKAAAYNINIGMLPTWGDKIFKDNWGTGPEIFTNEDIAAQYAGWLATRYKDKKNIIWVLGGDRRPRGEKDVAIWRAMGNAIMKATNNKAVITFHPQPNQLGSAEWFHQDAWLSLNMFQTGHCRDVPVYDRIQAAYNLKPAKPVLDGEPIYEDHPVCFNSKDLGTSSAYDVRRSAYLDIFAGAFGHTYGCHDIWQMYSPKFAPLNGPHVFWYDAMELPGASQMIFLRTLIESHRMTERVPDQSLVKENDTNPAERIQATRGNDYLFVYSTAGKPFTVIMGKIKGKMLQAYWYDPRKGKSTALDAVANNGTRLFTPPTKGYGQDWVLVLEDAAGNYPKP